MSEKALVAEGISKAFGAKDGSTRTVLTDVSIRIEPGQIIGLRGASGAGKSTLGRILAGLEVPDCGRCLCDGVPVESVRSRAGQLVRGQIGMVFQSPRRSCDPRMTLGQTIRLAVRGGKGKEIDGLVRKAGLSSDLLARFPSQVSDGQLQRAAVVRTLAARPRYLICDEMTAMLDAANSAAIVEVIRDFAGTGGGVLMISHEHRLLDAVCDGVVELGGGETAVEAVRGNRTLRATNSVSPF
ncbi:MAG: ATP-binding cassette domain-containing protein [Corynebacterium sp.]|uniref:ABC transporter ATP-binding protein n=1 Tax=Corynebacterium sp. TaxID=1720 RepID=UPI0026DD80E5|nr:ATP-binding cassette domain-containing protein [Corynebacterium sp.]MDO5030863.1 ATP-binding cassette domain-containing protein [Corynebacterium sp.]